MCDPLTVTALSAGVGAVGSYNQAQSQKKALNYQAQISDNNAVLANIQADQAIRDGQTQEQNSRVQSSQLKGNQRATMAANGIDVTDIGSANDIFTSTDYMADRDAVTIKNNALRQAWGYGVQADNYTNDATAKRAGADAISPGMAAATSLLTSAAGASSNWDKFSTSKPANNSGDGLSQGARRKIGVF